MIKSKLCLVVFFIFIPVFAQISWPFDSQKFDLTLMTGQEFLHNEVSFYIDDIEVIKKNKISSIIKITSTPSGSNYELVIAERDSKKDTPIYYSYSVNFISNFKYNGVSYKPAMIYLNHFYLNRVNK